MSGMQPTEGARPYGPEEPPAYPPAPHSAPTPAAARSWHALDPLPLVVGLVFVVAGVTYAGADVRGQDVHEGVLGAAVVALLALAAFAALLRGILRRVR